MKNLTIWVSAVLLLLVTSCQKEEPVIPLKSIEITPAIVEMEVNAKRPLNVILSPANATYQDLVWSSSDATIASVNTDGLVTTYSKPGKVIITAEHKAENNKDVTISATCKLIVKSAEPEDPDNPGGTTPEPSLVDSIAFTKSEYALTQYDTITIGQDLEILPAEMALTVTVEFKSLDSSVATVNAEGQVIGVGEGTTNITATADGKEATCTVHVSPFVAPQSLSLNYSAFTLITNGATLQLKATITPDDVTDFDVEWTSSNPSVATVSATGLVSPMSDEGNVTITCKHTAVNEYDKEVSATCAIQVEAPVPTSNFTETVSGVTFEMIGVEGGTFQMGATEEQVEDAWDDEKPVHTVSLSSFYLSKTEVTQAQYRAVMGENPSYIKGDNLPVERVDWNDAQAFCKKLSELTGKQYVLPTEAQWEYAARGGKYHENTKFAGSNQVDEVAWHSDNSNGGMHPVATKAPNALGLYDMSGNVWEWCADWWAYYSAEDQTNPSGPETGTDRGFRGGSWQSNPRLPRVSARLNYGPTQKGGDYGFRVAMIP